MMRRALIAVVILIPALILGARLLTEQLPIWTAPQQWWLPTDAPAACAAVGSMSAYRAVRSNETPAIPAVEAVRRAEKVIAWQYFTAGDVPMSEPLLISGMFDGETRLAWVITAALSTAESGGGTVIYVDAATGDPLAVVAALSPNAACPFDLRGALVDLVRSQAFLLFAGYAGAVMVAGAALLVIRLIQRRTTHVHTPV